jgi:chaperone required for assembly of F1-ATPase
MTGGWAPRRFWTEARAAPAEGGYAVELDGRAVKTPAKAALVVPSLALAEAIAAEWQAQAELVDPRSMPVTRAANSAIDKVTPQFDEVAGLIAAYGDSDLLCYRAESPEGLVERQAEAWDPLIAWAAEALEAELEPRQGISHRPQPTESLARLDRAVRALTPFELTALHDLVAISGSLVIGLAAIRGHRPAEALWQLSRVDEDWQQQLWGVDEEAAAAAADARAAFLGAARFHALCRP